MENPGSRIWSVELVLCILAMGVARLDVGVLGQMVPNVADQIQGHILAVHSTQEIRSRPSQACVPSRC